MRPGEPPASTWPEPSAFRRGVRLALFALALIIAIGWLTSPSPILAGLGSGAGVWVGALVGGYLANAPVSERRARLGQVLRGLVIVVLGLASVGALGFGAYVLSKSAGEAACVEAMRAPDEASRRAEGRAAEGRWAIAEALLHKRVTVGCATLERELDALAAEGACPRFPLAGVACRCGGDQFEGIPSTCPIDHLVCDYAGGDAVQRLRCVDEAEIVGWTEPRL